MSLQGVDGLQNHGASLRHSSLICQLCSHDKGHFRAVYRVVAAVQQGSFQADHRVACQHALFGSQTHALFHSGEEVLGHAAAEHLLLKHHLLAVAGLEVDDNVTELAVAAGLLLMASLLLARLADGLAVGDAGSFQTDLHTELVLQLGLDHVQMLLTQAADDLLMGLGVVDVAQGGIFFHQACQCAGDLALVALLGHGNSHKQAGLGEHRCGQLDHAVCIAQGIAGLCAHQLCHCADITGTDAVVFDLLLAKDSQGLGDLFHLAGAGVGQRFACGHLAADNAQIAQLAHERVSHGLKDVGGSGLILGAVQFHRLAVGVLGQRAGLVLRAGQQLVHIEQQHIQCLHVHGAAAEHGGDQAVLNALAHALHDLLGGKGFAAEELFHQIIVGFCNGLAHGLDQALETVADVRQVYLNLLAALVLKGLLAEQVDVHRGAVIQLCRHDTGADGGAEADLHILKDLEVVGVFQIALGHEHHGGLAVLAGQLERLFCAHGNAAAAGHAHQHALGGADALVLACFKVEQTRCIDQVVLDALVLHRHNGRRQAGLALCFLGIKVRNRGTVLNPAHTLGSARKIDQCFGQRGLAAAGMAGNQNIADVVACVFHIGFSLISAARSVLSVFVAYFTKIIPHLKRFLNISFQILAKAPAKLPGTVLCKLTFGCKTGG
jgi:hypothetical protein